MSWHKGGGRGRRGYHHGNLREALIGAALDLISQKGPAGVTFAEAARMAGVSTAAPYRHYRDRVGFYADAGSWGDAVSSPMQRFFRSAYRGSNPGLSNTLSAPRE